MKKMTLYESNEYYDVIISKDRDEWLKSRLGTIGGSDASCVIDKNSFKSREQYLEEFKSNELVEIKDNSAMKKGRELEPIIRQMFILENKSKYEYQYQENTILVSKKYKGLSYSPDGMLIEKKTNRKGGHEIKTTFIKNDSQMELWKGRIPTNYYIQCIHGMIVANLDFFILTARLEVYNKETKSKHFIIDDYKIERSYYIDDIEYLLDNELAFLREVNNK